MGNGKKWVKGKKEMGKNENLEKLGKRIWKKGKFLQGSKNGKILIFFKILII